jgi:hypothetical protein
LHSHPSRSFPIHHCIYHLTIYSIAKNLKILEVQLFLDPFEWISEISCFISRFVDQILLRFWKVFVLSDLCDYNPSLFRVILVLVRCKPQYRTRV